jgi:hypothetical protein
VPRSGWGVDRGLGPQGIDAVIQVGAADAPATAGVHSVFVGLVAPVYEERISPVLGRTDRTLVVSLCAALGEPAPPRAGNSRRTREGGRPGQ